MSSFAEFRERVEVVSETLLDLLLGASEREPQFENSGAAHALRDALGALAELPRGKSATIEEAVIDNLAHAKSAIEKAGTMLADASARDTVRESAGFLDELRAQAVELLVERDKARSHGRDQAPPRLPFLVAHGAPTLVQTLRLSVPRLFAPDDDDKEFTDSADPQSTGGTLGERKQVEALARACMEDIASLSVLRDVSPAEAWTEAEPFEQRLLANLNGLLALAHPVRADAPVLDLAASLHAYASEWGVPDRGRSFTFAFVVSCIDSEASHLWVNLGLRACEEWTLPSFVGALVLGSNGAVTRQLLSEDAPREVLLVVLRAMLRRGIFDRRLVSLALHHDPEVASLATRCFLHAPPEVAKSLLDTRSSSRRSLTRAAFAWTMVALGDAEGVAIARDLLDEELSNGPPVVRRGEWASMPKGRQEAVMLALRTLVLWGDRKDEARVWASAHALTAYREVGFFGAMSHVPRMFAALEELEAEARSAVGSTPGATELARLLAAAVTRISGVSAEWDLANLDLVRFKQRFIASESEGKWLTSDDDPLRFGVRWTEKGVVEELAHPKTAQGDRRLLADELTVMSKGKFRFDPDDWVGNQRALLKLLQQTWA